jgi:hypothetical protein
MLGNIQRDLQCTIKAQEHEELDEEDEKAQDEDDQGKVQGQESDAQVERG